jgi:hypothetical protein
MAAIHASPTVSSTNGYCTEIGSPHALHLARRASQLTIGMFSYQAI